MDMDDGSMSHSQVWQKQRQGREHLFFKAHLEGDMHRPQGACHLAHCSCKLVHLIIGEHPAATVRTKRDTASKRDLVLKSRSKCLGG